MEVETNVSVIVLNCEGRNNLKACLSAVMSLAFPADKLEIIVVDNGHTDGSAFLIKSEFPRITLIQNELGFSAAVQKGAAIAKGEYLAFLNSAMLVDENWLSALVEAAREGRGIECVGSTVVSLSGIDPDFAERSHDPFCLATAPTDERSLYSSASGSYYRALFAPGGATIIRRQVFMELGGFDPEFSPCSEDVDLGWRLWLRGYECTIAKKSLVYRQGEETSSDPSPELLQRVRQRHALFSAFKNLESTSLREVLPLLLFFFLERSRSPAAQQALAFAIEEFKISLDSLIAKRNAVQSTRLRNDAELFARVAHPFNFLIRGASYESIRRQLLESCSDITFDPNDSNSSRDALTCWVSRVQCLYESRLREELQTLLAREANHSRQLEELNRDQFSYECRLAFEVERVLAREAQSFLEQSQELENAIRVRDETITRLQSELCTFQERITNSLVWRLLGRYGRIKYRYLLPLYRLLGLPPYGRKAVVTDNKPPQTS